MPIKDHPLENALWAHTATAPPETIVLEGEHQTDVAIIGAGAQGLATVVAAAVSGADGPQRVRPPPRWREPRKPGQRP